MKALTLMLTLGLSLLPQLAQAKDYTREQYIEIFSGQNEVAQRRAIESLVLSGFTDPEIFDLVSARLDESLPYATDRDGVDESAWLMRALSYSGNPKYLEQLQKIQAGDHHRKVRGHAKKAIAELKNFKIWNKTLLDSSKYTEGQTQRNNILATALKSKDLDLIHRAVRFMASERNRDPFLMNIIAAELENPRLLSKHGDAQDTYAWLVKVLASSGEEQYKPLVKKMTLSEYSKVAKHAKKALKQYYY